MYRPPRRWIFRQWVLMQFRWIGEGVRWVLLEYVKAVIIWSSALVLILGAAWLGYQQLPEEVRHLISLEGLQELSAAISSAEEGAQ